MEEKGEIISRYLAKWQFECSRRELCEYKIRRKLNMASKQKLSDKQIDNIIELLKKDNYLNDRRYADAYIKDKTNFSGWGMRKIKQGLCNDGIEKSIIEAAVDSFIKNDNGGEKQFALLEKLAKQKWQSLKMSSENKGKNDDVKVLKSKLLRFLIGRGYEYDIVYEFVCKLR